MSWFGDRDAARRRQRDHSGRGPTNYTRSDDRIREDVNDKLTDDWGVDARKVTVTVNNGEVTLDGTVSTRLQKRRAEDCADDVSGVKHVQNNLRVQDSSTLGYPRDGRPEPTPIRLADPTSACRGKGRFGALSCQWYARTIARRSVQSSSEKYSAIRSPSITVEAARAMSARRSARWQVAAPAAGRCPVR